MNYIQYIKSLVFKKLSNHSFLILIMFISTFTTACRYEIEIEIKGDNDTYSGVILKNIDNSSISDNSTNLNTIDNNNLDSY